VDSLDEGVRTDEIIVIFQRFSILFHMLMKIAATGVDLRVVVWVQEFFLGRWQRVTVNGQLSEEVRILQECSKGAYYVL
jgi:hypothetical protein